LVHWPLMGGLLHLVQRGGDWAGQQQVRIAYHSIATIHSGGGALTCDCFQSNVTWHNDKYAEKKRKFSNRDDNYNKGRWARNAPNSAIRRVSYLSTLLCGTNLTQIRLLNPSCFIYLAVGVYTTTLTRSNSVSSIDLMLKTRGQSNLTKSASRGAHSPVRGHPRGAKVVPLNSWGRFPISVP